jgi:hypothetical protein
MHLPLYEAVATARATAVVNGQIDINEAEAANPSVFVAGWRLEIGWICGAACAWNWIALPVVKVALIVSSQAFRWDFIQ